MKCQKCGKNEASTHYTEVLNGQKKELHLCSECAHSLASSTNLNALFQDSLQAIWNPNGNLWGDLLGANVGAQEEPTCHCGMSESRLKRLGKVGCADCYQTFNSLLMPYIQKLHGAVQHIGTAPSAVPEAQEDPVAVLKQQLQDAIAKEEYEQAAHLRDEIRRLEAS